MKKIIALFFSLILIFSVIMMISGCNKDDEKPPVTNESTDTIFEKESSTEKTSDDETESTTEKPTESTSKADENKTEESTEPTETTTEDKKSDICEHCGGTIIDDSNTSQILIGAYCDGRCDEWIDF